MKAQNNFTGYHIYIKYESTFLKNFNSPLPGAAYMCQWNGPALVQIMACRLFGAKPLPEPMLTYYQLDPKEQISVKFESRYKKIVQKTPWNYRRRNGGHFLQAEMR